MNNFLKVIKQKIDKSQQNKVVERDNDGRVVVNMTVKNDDNFLSCFSADDTAVISDEVASFLENSVSGVAPKERLSLNVSSDCIDENEKAVYTKAIKKYYTDKYVENERHLRRNFILALILGILGIMILAFALILEYANKSLLWVEVVDVVAWVFIWESVDIIFFQNYLSRLNRVRYLAFVDMKIEFINNNN